MAKSGAAVLHVEAVPAFRSDVRCQGLGAWFRVSRRFGVGGWWLDNHTTVGAKTWDVGDQAL